MEIRKSHKGYILMVFGFIFFFLSIITVGYAFVGLFIVPLYFLIIG
jgi:hypothetical protein